jgi:FkbM family methyltransferase
MTLLPLNTETRPKLIAARLLGSSPVARCVSTLSRHRIPSFDLTFDTRDAVITPKVEAQLLWRLYESAEIRLVRKYLTGCNTIVDLGASLGFTASHALARMAPNGRLIAVEPNRRLLRSLSETLNRHAAGRAVEIVSCAISYQKNTAVRLNISEDNVGSRIDEIGEIVDSATLSDIVTRHEFQRFAMISDIEGAEASVIFEDPALDKCDRMVIELHETTYAGKHVSVENLYDGLIKRGFATMEQQGPVFALERVS